MPITLMSLRFAVTCRQCQTSLPVNVAAYYDTDAHTVVCVACHDGAAAGLDLRHDYERRRSDEEPMPDEPRGRFSAVAKAFSSEPRSTAAWHTAADGERRVAAQFERDLDGSVVVLHSRRVPNTRGDIDHVLIASSGVWIVDAKHYRGRVEVRDVGSWSTVDNRLFVDGRDRSDLVDGLTWQVAAVRSALDPLDLGDAPVHPTLAFVDADWGWFAKPIELLGVRVLWPSKLTELVAQPGPLDGATVTAVAAQLSAKLPAKRG